MVIKHTPFECGSVVMTDAMITGQANGRANAPYPRCGNTCLRAGRRLICGKRNRSGFGAKVVTVPGGFSQQGATAADHGVDDPECLGSFPNGQMFHAGESVGADVMRLPSEPFALCACPCQSAQNPFAQPFAFEGSQRAKYVQLQTTGSSGQVDPFAQ